MFSRWLRQASLTTLVLLQLPGCAHLCHKPTVPPAPFVSGFPPPGRVFAPPVHPLPQVHPPLGVPGPGVRVHPPEWRPPADSLAPGVRMYPPEWRAVPDGGAPPLADRAGARLLPPVFDAAPQNVPNPATPPNAPAPTPALPVGIPQFAMARERVASGLKPLLDGLDWLQANGYRAVLHLRAPGQDDSADRREVEKRGLKYLAIEVGPQTLTRAVVEEFNRTVAEAGSQPLFVYDKDGRLAGGLWYLHFRTAEKAGDELARSKASRLGLREDGDGEQRLLWLAIQKVLSEWGG